MKAVSLISAIDLSKLINYTVLTFEVHSAGLYPSGLLRTWEGELRRRLLRHFSAGGG